MARQYVQSLGQGVLNNGQGEFRLLNVDGVSVLRDGNCQTVGCYIDAETAIEVPQTYRRWIPKLAGKTVIFRNPFGAEAVYFAQNGEGVLPVTVSFVGPRGVQRGDRLDAYVEKAERKVTKKEPDEKRVGDVAGFMKEMARTLGYQAR